MEKELAEQSERLKELSRSKAEIERLKREKDQLREDIGLEKEKEFSDKLKEEQKRIQLHVEEANTLKLKDREKVIEDLKNQLDEAKRRADQGSMQMQGEVQELEIESILRGLYPLDENGGEEGPARGRHLTNGAQRAGCGLRQDLLREQAHEKLR